MDGNGSTSLPGASDDGSGNGNQGSEDIVSANLERIEGNIHALLQAVISY